MNVKRTEFRWLFLNRLFALLYVWKIPSWLHTKESTDFHGLEWFGPGVTSSDFVNLIFSNDLHLPRTIVEAFPYITQTYNPAGTLDSQMEENQ